MTTQGQPMPFAAHVEAFDLHGQYEERAAILEYEGGYPRDMAEHMARLQVYRNRSEPA